MTMPKNNIQRCLLLVSCMLLVSMMVQQWLPARAWALTPKEQYYRAEKAYSDLKKNVRHQKYRDKWLNCIDKFEKVTRLKPNGPWAAAGLYKSGLLYLELYKRSYLSSDRGKAMDAFERIVNRYPKSRYAPKSRSQLKELKQKQKKTAQKAPAPSHLARAHKAYKQLMDSPRKQKYRDQWEKCIDRFKVVYRANTRGPHAAESMYMIGYLYKGLSGVSRRADDKKLAMDYFRRVKHDFSGSPFARKAAAELRGQPAPHPKKAPDDPLADVIAKNQPPASAPSKITEDIALRTGLVTVKGLRFWSNPNYTRIVIDADRETNFSHRLLKKDPSIKKPQRLYIDLTKSRLGKNIPKFIPINDELLSDARAGQYTPASVRIVVDIKSFKHYKIFSLKNPFRIVLDVWGQETRTQTAGQKAPTRPSTGKVPAGAIARQLALGVSRIVIDPGHGGKDYGAPGYLKGVHEKHIVLQIAKRLARKVESDLKCDAVLTRSTDRFLTLEERTAIANTQNADLFVSIHTNAVRDKRAYGIETYFLNLATDDDAIRVAARENATSTKNISDLESILSDLMQNAKINESSRLAAMVQNETCLHLKKKFSHIRNKGVKQAPFYVLLGAQMPALLVETSFISNPRECKRLTSAKYQEALCDGIIKGIRNYIREISPKASFRQQSSVDANG
ncbi:MAG: N-acetylmuramoyl-L-alanine amidase [Proteobacteria bacterium]|nr:MAG: N-acetylmuramoyl-L-alanine amidase [Pseudomonadota bacterium]PIE66825.1 MAG: N-acetylmuramoyl-L-alanine amidase [Deltaproteobacteria bacterium]